LNHPLKIIKEAEVVQLPPRGTKTEELKCKKCGKTPKECKPKDCTDAECPYKQEAGE